MAAKRTDRTNTENEVVTKDRRQPDAEIGLLKQLRRLVPARSATQSRRLVGATGLIGLPIEVCEVRAMLAADGLELAPEIGIDYETISNVDLPTQIQNALQFVDATADGLEVAIFVNGREVDRAELLQSLEPGAATSGGSPIFWEAIPSEPAGPSSSGEFGADLASDNQVDQRQTNSINEDVKEDFADLSIKPDDLDQVSHSPVPDEFYFAGLESDPDQPPPDSPHSSPKPSDPPGDDSQWDEDSLLDDTASQDSDLSGLSLPPNGQPPLSNPEPTTVTTVIKTDSGIFVLHQTSAGDGFPTNSVSTFQAVQRFILSQSRQLRESKAQSELQRFEQISTAQLSAVTSQLDDVFVDSGSLFDELQNDLSSQNAGSLKQPESQAPFADLPDQLDHKPTYSTTEKPQRLLPPTIQWAREVRRLFSESTADLLAAEAFATPTAELQAEVFVVDEFVQSGQPESSAGVLKTRLFWSATLRNKKSVDEIQLADIARQAVQPIDSSTDLRNSELSRSLNFLASLAGESAITIPRRLPEHPPQLADAMCLATRLLCWINPRGPPDSEEPTGFSRQEAVLLQHQRLKYSIAPRSPSACFFT